MNKFFFLLLVFFNINKVWAQQIEPELSAVTNSDSTAVDSTKTDSTKTAKVKKWQIISNVGLNLSHTLNINKPAGSGEGFGFTNSIDLNANYIPAKSQFSLLNELHFIFTLNKSSSKSRTLLAADQIITLHDIAWTIKKGGDWNINIIVKTESPLASQYDGSFLKDYNQLGRVKAFLNPYKFAFAPGIKYQPTQKLGISISPYSFQYEGVTQQFIADKGLYFKERRADGHYENKFFEPLGLESNIWLTTVIKKRLDLNYRMSLSTNYTNGFGKNGKFAGIFITKLNIIGGLALSHRASLDGDLSLRPVKPEYTQIVLLSYTLVL